MRKLVGWLTALLGAVGTMLLLLPGTASACEVRYAAAAASSCGDGTKVVVVTATVAGSGLGIALVRHVIQVTSASAQQLAATDARLLDWALRDLEAETGEQENAVEEGEVEETSDNINDAAEKVADVVSFNESLAVPQSSMPVVNPLSYGALDPISALALNLSLFGHLWVYRWELLEKTNIMYYKLLGLID